ncbi:acetyltransferase [Xenophilus azovorans]|uniref:acetyltransferase n=1 Tax=Xenophilus TaxID=151754 RepID=UPI00056E42B3|nr:acetyltransferase [Xenophilus azovorans]
MSLLDAGRSRPLEGGASYSIGHRLFRALWNLAWLLCAAWTPPPLHRWRGLLLRLFGADVHPTARVYGKARIWYPPHLTMGAYAVLGPGVDCYCQGRITIGEKAVVSQGASLCAGTHDIADPNFQLVQKPIAIGAHAWIAAEAFVGPGVTVNEGAVVGARAVLFKDAEPWGVYVGNPARWIKTRVLRQPAPHQAQVIGA